MSPGNSHANDIVQVVREEFGKSYEFAQTITCRTTDGKPENLLAAFRNSMYPRILVTVDMIATGPEVKPIECVLFVRDVKGRACFEQTSMSLLQLLDNAEAGADDAHPFKWVKTADDIMALQSESSQ